LLYDDNESKGKNKRKDTSETTEIFRGTENATEAIIRFVKKANNEINACLDSTGPSVMLGVESIKKARLEAKKRGVQIRYVTEITKDNIDYSKEMMSLFEVRHLQGMKGNFEVCDRKEYVAIVMLQKAKPIAELTYSNVKQIVEQEQYVFETFWNKAIPAEERIKEIEQGIKPDCIEIIRDPEDAQKIEREILASSTEEIQIIYSTANTFSFQDKAGVTQYLSELSKKGIKIRLLAPTNPSIKTILEDLKQNPNISIRDTGMNSISPASIKFKTLVVDKKHSLIMEIRDDLETTFNKAIGISTYSNSKPTVLSYASIFETLWKQNELYEQLKESDRIKNEFINIAAHELRTPIMPIIGGLELIEEKIKENTDIKIDLEMVGRNANRLQKLAEDILEVSRIESNSFTLRLEDKVDIHSLITDTIRDIEKKYRYTGKKDNVSILFNHLEDPNNDDNNEFTVSCDSQKISEVLFNLIDNAMKFTENGTISIYTTFNTTSYPSLNYNQSNTAPNDMIGKNELKQNILKENLVTISITDTGSGIDPTIKDRLFEKFVTASTAGTGLGLYLSKKIAEAHGGTIMAECNKDGMKGSTFALCLPINKKVEKLHNI
jgi:two-component system sensor histidine kinase VicK